MEQYQSKKCSTLGKNASCDESILKRAQYTVMEKYGIFQWPNEHFQFEVNFHL